jgi:S-DNA-T family DNA segregation ATPase FtsK/SpoIIIE
MNNLSAILTAAYNPSREADQAGKELKKNFGCDANYEVIRLALGRSLSLDTPPDPAPDAKGSAIRGLQLFGDESNANYLWIALLGEELRLAGGGAEFSLDSFQKLVRDHWHRGVQLLALDWQAADEDYPRFLDLMARKAELPEYISAIPLEPEVMLEPVGKAESDHLIKQLRDLSVVAEIRDSIIGPRLTRYRLYLPNTGDRTALQSKLGELGFALGVGDGLALSDADEPRVCLLDCPRVKVEWRVVGCDQFDRVASAFAGNAMRLPVTPGVDVAGMPVIFDLAEAPHLLIGGTTGSGKSVCMNALLLSLLAASRKKPIQLALIDPKQVELTNWRGCANLFGEIATSSTEAMALLDTLIDEMNTRYQRFSALGVKDIAGARERGFEGGWIAVAVDELADLIMQNKQAESRLVELAQKSRAAGIHLVLATQRPDAKTFTGLLRSNCPTRIALKVQKHTESTIILDESGAEKLLGAGDMLFKGIGMPMQRVHGYWITSEDVTRYLK